jgi:outer membrane protein OmpA-like peptidoglycan-associated protein
MGYTKIQGSDSNAIFTSTQNSEGFGDFFIIKFQSIEPLFTQGELIESEQLKAIEASKTPAKEEVTEILVNADSVKAENNKTITSTPTPVIDTTVTQKELNIENTQSGTPLPQPSQKHGEIQVLDAQTKNPVDYKIEIGNARGVKKVAPTQNQVWEDLEDAQWVSISISSKGYIPRLLDRQSWLDLNGKEILLTPAVAGTAIILENIQFNRGTSDFADSKSIQVLDDLVVFLKENSGIKIRLEGHTDNAGDPSLNKDLSMKRASKIRGYLTLNGVEFERVRISGWGGTRPIADNSTEDGKQINRRVEMLIEN